MKKFIISSLFLAVAFAASESLSTIQSTLVSTLPCSSQSANVVPSQFFYANVSTFASLSTTYDVVDVSSSQTAINAGSEVTSSAQPSSKARQTIYDYDTAYDNEVFEVTHTVCDSYSHCYVTTDLESSTTYTTTIDGILTVITTVVPVSATTTGSSSEFTQTAAAQSSAQSTVAVTSSSEVTQETASEGGQGAKVETSAITQPSTTDAPSTKTEETTTVVTITSCDDNKCSIVPRTTGLTVVTITSNDMVTAYTTYCPLTGETSSSAETSVPAETVAPSIQSTSGLIESSEVEIESSATEIPPPQAESTQGESISAESTPVETQATEVAPPYTEASTVSTSVPNDKLSTVNVITNNIVTQTPESSTVSQQTTSADHQINSQFTTFEGAANSIVGSTGLIGLLISFIFMML